MTGHVHQQTPSALIWYKSPWGRGLESYLSMPKQSGSGQNRFANSSVFKQLFDLQDDRIEAPVVGNPQLDSVAATGLNHASTFLRVHGHGLFTKNMFAFLGGHDCL